MTSCVQHSVASRHRLRRSLRALAALAGAGVCVACSLSPASAPEVGARAPNFSLPSLSDPAERVGLSRERVTLVDFWATWCAPCTRALPAYERIVRTRPAVRVVAVDEDVSAGDARRFLAGKDMQQVASSDRFAFAHDPGSRVAREYELDGLPALFLVDRSGYIRVVHQGFQPGDEKTLADQVDAILNEVAR